MYEYHRKYFPTPQLMEEFIEILENNKCDYGCREPQIDYVKRGYITEEWYEKYW
jgi:hypothetical protein